MRLSAILLAAASTLLADADAQITTGQLGNATQNLNNPEGAAYRAVVADNAMGITGSITAVSAGDKGVEFAVDFENLPTEGGPFRRFGMHRAKKAIELTFTAYHTHVMPVSSDGNCTSTLGHLDPFIRGETPPCAPDQPETCQVGDLAGKYGKANGTSFQSSYTDPFVSLTEGMGAFFGNRSFVIHFANTTRIACGNFTSLSNAEAATTSIAGAASSASSLFGASGTSIPAFTNSSTAATHGNGTAAITSPATPLASLTTTIPASKTSGSKSSQSAAPAQATGSAASIIQIKLSFLLLALSTGLGYLL
jgi:hypothetical protein